MKFGVAVFGFETTACNFFHITITVSMKIPHQITADSKIPTGSPQSGTPLCFASPQKESKIEKCFAM